MIGTFASRALNKRGKKIFSYFSIKARFGYLLDVPHPGTFNVYPHFHREIRKMSR